MPAHFVHASLFVSCLGWVYSVRLAGMCQPALRVCVCLVSGRSLLCETRGDVPAPCSRVCASCLGCIYYARLVGMCLPTLCVCLVPGLCLLCEARAGVPAHCSCVCAPRALAESIVRDSWGCASPFVHASLFVSCLGWVFSVRLAGMCQPALRACVPLVWGESIVRDSWGCACPLFVRVCATCLG